MIPVSRRKRAPAKAKRKPRATPKVATFDDVVTAADTWKAREAEVREMLLAAREEAQAQLAALEDAIGRLGFGESQERDDRKPLSPQDLYAGLDPEMRRSVTTAAASKLINLAQGERQETERLSPTPRPMMTGKVVESGAAGYRWVLGNSRSVLFTDLHSCTAALNAELAQRRGISVERVEAVLRGEQTLPRKAPFASEKGRAPSPPPADDALEPDEGDAGRFTDADVVDNPEPALQMPQKEGTPTATVGWIHPGSGWGPPDEAGIARHELCGGRGKIRGVGRCAPCQGQGFKRCLPNRATQRTKVAFAGEADE